MKLITKEENTKISSHALAAKNIKSELKAKFPGQKFSVKSSSFSMGDDVRIDWVDGPTSEEVEMIVKKYEYGTFDGMTDSSGVKDTFKNGLYGESKYVMTQREISTERRNDAIQNYEKEFGVKYDDNLHMHYTSVNAKISNTSYYKVH